MPRRNPLPQHEKEISQRLRTFRENTGLSQSQMGMMSGVDSSQLAAVEHLRTPLKYGIAFRLIQYFCINAEWLATGALPMKAWSHVVPPEVLGVSEKALFSQVYKENLLPLIIQIEENMQRTKEGKPMTLFFPFHPDDERGRLFGLEWIQNAARDWFARIPPGRIAEFLDFILRSAEDFFRKYERVPEVEATRRVQQLEDHISLKAILRQKDFSWQNTPEGVISGSMQASRLISRLLARVKRAVEERGTRSQLARALEVTPQQITDWLTGIKTPSGENTLRLLEWVTIAEAKQKRPGSVVAPPGQRPKKRNTPK